MSDITLRANLTALINEYNLKVEAVSDTILKFEKAGAELKGNSCISGAWGNENIDVGRVHEGIIKASLLKSAWRKVYELMNIEFFATAKDKKRYEQDLEKPPEFTLDNIRATFGQYYKDPMMHILRGMAEVFCELDQAYKSHERVKIGVKGLPKRIIISNIDSIHGWGRDRLRDVINALAVYQGKSLIEHQELTAFIKDGNLYKERKSYMRYNSKTHKYEEILPENRDIWAKTYKNGNCHIFFGEIALIDINKALSAYYGDVLADCYEAPPSQKRANTDICKDLQYYPTPEPVIQIILRETYIRNGELILEPSCGCGRIMDALKKKGARVFGVEYDKRRAAESRGKGHDVLCTNFLDTLPIAKYDKVVMNPPFYGRHYVKHVEHALNFLKEGGLLIAILPATARYDHKILKGKWIDLPLGSFKESGTNINTTILTIKK